MIKSDGNLKKSKCVKYNWVKESKMIDNNIMILIWEIKRKQLVKIWVSEYGVDEIFIDVNFKEQHFSYNQALVKNVNFRRKKHC